MDSPSTPSPRRRHFAWPRIFVPILVVYSIMIWYGIEDITDSGALLDSWRQEYAGGGSMAFRTPQGHAFVSLAIPWGLLVYPAAFISALALIGGALRPVSIGHRILRLILSATMLAIFLRFISIGVASCSLGSL